MAGMRKRVVFVDNDPQTVELCRLILAHPEIEYVGEYDGRSGLETIQRLKPDLVLLDLMMPALSGWEVYDRMRADSELRSTPVIIITARSSKTEEVFARSLAHVFDYFVKPFRPAALRESVERALALLVAIS